MVKDKVPLGASCTLDIFHCETKALTLAELATSLLHRFFFTSLKPSQEIYRTNAHYRELHVDTLFPLTVGVCEKQLYCDIWYLNTTNKQPFSCFGVRLLKKKLKRFGVENPVARAAGLLSSR